MQSEIFSFTVKNTNCSIHIMDLCTHLRFLTLRSVISQQERRRNNLCLYYNKLLLASIVFSERWRKNWHLSHSLAIFLSLWDVPLVVYSCYRRPALSIIGLESSLTNYYNAATIQPIVAHVSSTNEICPRL